MYAYTIGAKGAAARKFLTNQLSHWSHNVIVYSEKSYRVASYSFATVYPILMTEDVS